MFESLDYVAVNFETENQNFLMFHILWNGGFKLKLDQYRLYLSFNEKVNCYLSLTVGEARRQKNCMCIKI